MRSRAVSSSLLLLAICLLGLISTPPLPGPAYAAARCAACKIYLPIVVWPLPMPQLVAPAEGAQVSSLAPLIMWTPAITGTYKIEVSTSSAFPPSPTTEVSATAQVQNLQAQVHVMDSNLKLGATIYYWRVGVLFGGRYLFAPTRSFTTPSASAVALPPAPAPLSPANHATLSAPEADLSWQSVPGALYYRVKVYSPGPTLFSSAVVPASSPVYHVAGLSPGVTYTWKVKTLDQQAWGNYGAVWSFTAP